MSDPTLDTIDHVLQDYAVSGDAMRWMPDPAVRPKVPASGYPGIDFETFSRMAEAYRRAMQHLIAKFNEFVPVMTRTYRLMQAIDATTQARRSVMHAQYRRRSRRRNRR